MSLWMMLNVPCKYATASITYLKILLAVKSRTYLFVNYFTYSRKLIPFMKSVTKNICLGLSIKSCRYITPG